MKHLKRNIVIVTVLVFVCAAVYLNWSYNRTWGEADEAMVEAEDNAMAAAQEAYEAAQVDASAENDYFSSARLSRQQSRDEAIELLCLAAEMEAASQEAVDSAVNDMAVMAAWTTQEAQIENLLTAKDFAQCVVFISGDAVTVAVPAPAEGLSEAAVARITDAVSSETEFEVSQIHIVEVKEE